MLDVNLSGWAGHQKLKGIIGASPVAVFSWIRFTGAIICESGRLGLYKQHRRRELIFCADTFGTNVLQD